MKGIGTPWAGVLKAHGTHMIDARFEYVATYSGPIRSRSQASHLTSGRAQTWLQDLNGKTLVTFGTFQRDHPRDSGQPLCLLILDDDFLAEHVHLCDQPENVIEKMEALARRLGVGTDVPTNMPASTIPRPWGEFFAPPLLRRFAKVKRPARATLNRGQSGARA